MYAGNDTDAQSSRTCTCTAGSLRVITNTDVLSVSRIARTDLRPATSVSERGASGSVSSVKFKKKVGIYENYYPIIFQFLLEVDSCHAR